MHPKELVVIALGCNLGDSQRIILRAMERLDGLSSQPMSRSSLWQSTPVDCPPGSPPFVNAVVGLSPQPDETPETLLAKLQALEKEFGRRPRVMVNEPRQLDLDLIVFGQETRSTEELILPHPRAHERRFVLQPLGEIAPSLVLPWQTSTVIELLRALRTGEVLVRLLRSSEGN